MSGFRHHRGRLAEDEIGFSYNGRILPARVGDTVASALLANGIEVIGRSFKYHRPRGVTSCGAEETGALVTIGSGAAAEPNVRATMQLVTAGMQVSSQNCWPSAQFDLLAINNLVGSILPGSPFAAGFYYKTFMWPARLWYQFYEPSIRRAAGMGKVPTQADGDVYDRVNSFCDLAIVGGGAAGLSAALSASQSGLRVVLMDEHASLGGQLLNAPAQQTALDQWRLDTIAALSAADNVILLPNTICWGRFDGNTLAAHEMVDSKVRHNYHKIHAKKIIIASGAIERPLVFANNDKPGVMLASGVRKLLNHYGVAAGKKLLVFTNNDSAYQTAFDYHEQGIQVSAVIDSRQQPSEQLLTACAERGIPVHRQSVVIKAKGWHGVRSVLVAHLGADGVVGPSNSVACDLVAHSGGWTPQVQMASHGGRPPVYNQQLTAFVVDQQAADTWSVGGAQGELGLYAAIDQAVAAAQAACQQLNSHGGDVVKPTQDCSGELNIEPLWRVPAKGKQFIDIQHDVTSADIRQSHIEGFVSVEHMKRYTTLGMANDQGRTANVNALALMAQCQGQSIEATGTTRFRPPIAPVSLGGIGGREVGQHVRPLRRTPMQDWHERQGAVFVETGLFRRAQYYPLTSETIDEAYVREAAHVRTKVAICDVSSLGKIEVVGPDAAEFLDRIYINMFSTLPINKARYGIMLREDGHIFDDGTTSRLADDRYFMTTTTAQAGPVLSHLERCLEIDWPELRVRVSSVSERWAAMAVAGPQSRATLQMAFPDIDFSNQALPFMGVVHGEFQGTQLRILRISFSGEMAYEVYTEAHYGEQVWQHIMAVGQTHEIIAYGLEAMGALRIEKGHVTGAELDGRTTLADVNMQGMASKKKWFVGQNLLQRQGMQDANRPCLVGLQAVDPQQAIMAGSILVTAANATVGCDKQGWVSSMTYSPALNSYIALGFLRDGHQRYGEKLYASYPLQGINVAVEVVSQHFYDPDNKRVKG
ncbi:MAG: sarcosine oxidase subunit alpha family protein [Gammaproteobacteria bacterium]|nr:sarcosine oxidase subunit alpha family protein [Gammaproteobacteria bacterium]